MWEVVLGDIVQPVLDLDIISVEIGLNETLQINKKIVNIIQRHWK